MLGEGLEGANLQQFFCPNGMSKTFLDANVCEFILVINLVGQGLHIEEGDAETD